jgi:hypothetical protein
MILTYQAMNAVKLLMLVIGQPVPNGLANETQLQVNPYSITSSYLSQVPAHLLTTATCISPYACKLLTELHQYWLGRPSNCCQNVDIIFTTVHFRILEMEDVPD